MLFDPVLASLTVRQALARRRWMIVTLIAAIPVAVAMLFRIYGVDDETPLATMASIFPTLIVTAVVPIIALVLASASFSTEVDDGTVIYLLTKPVARTGIAVTRLVVTGLLCAAFGAGSTLVTGLLLIGRFDSTGLVAGFTVGAAVGSALYSAIFLTLGLITRRGLLIGLTYLIVWEGALSRLFAGTRVFSVGQYMLGTAASAASAAHADPAVFRAGLSSATAWSMSLVVAIATTLLCVYRLRRFELGHSG